MDQGIDFDCAFNSALRARSEAAIFPASTYVPKHNTSTLINLPLSAIYAYVHDGNYESTRKLSQCGRSTSRRTFPIVLHCDWEAGAGARAEAASRSHPRSKIPIRREPGITSYLWANSMIIRKIREWKKHRTRVKRMLTKQVR